MSNTNVWRKIGDFNITQLGMPYNRKVCYECRLPNPLIQRIELYGYDNNEFTLTIKMPNNDHYEQVATALRTAGLDERSVNFFGMHTILRLKTQKFSEIDTFLRVISNEMRECELIKDEIYAALGIPVRNSNPIIEMHSSLDIQNIFLNLRSSLFWRRLLILLQDILRIDNAQSELISFFQTHITNNNNLGFSVASTPSLPPPQLSKNQEKLDQLKITDDQISEEFLCAISKMVIDIPVYDVNLPQVKFDQAQILHWLKLNQTHPLSREPMGKLKVDEELKKRIEDFVSKCENPAPVQPQPAILHLQQQSKRKYVSKFLELMDEAQRFIGEELPSKRRRKMPGGMFKD